MNGAPLRILQLTSDWKWTGPAEPMLELAAGHSILLEEYARAQIAAEEEHLSEIRKMMRRS